VRADYRSNPPDRVNRSTSLAAVMLYTEGKKRSQVANSDLGPAEAYSPERKDKAQK
jgi:hypothetical protein